MTDGPLSNPTLQRVLEQQREQLHKRGLSDLREVLSTPGSRRWFHRLVFGICRLQKSTYDPTVKDGICAGQHQAHLDGQRSIGGVLLVEAQTHYPELWLKLIEEGIAQDREDRAMREQANKPTGDDDAD